jgi:hypothetical protein
MVGNLDVAALDDDLGVRRGFRRLVFDQQSAVSVHGMG